MHVGTESRPGFPNSLNTRHGCAFLFIKTAMQQERRMGRCVCWAGGRNVWIEEWRWAVGNEMRGKSMQHSWERERENMKDTWCCHTHSWSAKHVVTKQSHLGNYNRFPKAAVLSEVPCPFVLNLNRKCLGDEHSQYLWSRMCHPGFHFLCRFAYLHTIWFAYWMFQCTTKEKWNMIPGLKYSFSKSKTPWLLLWRRKYLFLKCILYSVRTRECSIQFEWGNKCGK